MLIISNKYKKLIKLLGLNKPLVIFDCETTGLSISSDKIVSLAYIKIWPDGRLKKKNMLFNPELKIPAESIAIHGIRNRDVKNKPLLRDRAQELWDVFNDCFYSGFGILNFDLPILRREFIRVGYDFDYDTKKVIDTREVFSFMSPRTLSSAYEHYCRKELKKQNSATYDTEAAAEVLLKQIEKYPEVRDLKFINYIHQTEERTFIDNTRKFYWVNGETYFAFSKYRDRCLKEVVKKDPKFCEWILGAEFSDETKNIIRLAMSGGKTKKIHKKFDNTKK